MAKKRMYAVVGLTYPKDENARKAILAGEVPPGSRECCIRVEAGQAIPRPIPGSAVVNGKRVTIEKHWLATGRVSITDPGKE